MDSEDTEKYEQERSLAYPNAAAFLITPIWCIRNGFWLSSVMTVIAYTIYWPVGAFISLVFFFLGNKWSWGDGTRWNSFEEFRDSQYIWNGIAILLPIVMLVIIYL